MVVAIPQFGETVAPCFEVARVFVLARFEHNQLIETKTVSCSGCEGFGRVQLLRDKSVGLLICNGIKGFYRDLLEASGVTVIAKVSGATIDALNQYLEGALAASVEPGEPVGLDVRIPLEDLVCWTQELFTAHGFTVRPGAELAPFPIDLVAELDCPACGKPIRVAICCGAHTYRPEQEIQQLHLAAVAGYNARVYVHTATSSVRRLCDQYGIEVIDPDERFASCDHPVKNAIPILQGAITGHDRASLGMQNSTEE